jgi:phage N-6-adenine-methyltransferase
MPATSFFTGVALSSMTDQWSTPPETYAALHSEFGFTLDVCASAANAKCAAYYTTDDDGLAQDWGLNVCWMNPPYGRTIKLWMRKAYEASQAGATVVCLVPSRTGTRWWHDYSMKGEIRFIKGRLKFGGSKNSAPFDSAVVVFRSCAASR